MIIFHGGCVGCTQQTTHSIEFCRGCCYFSADWSLPDLSTKDTSEESICIKKRRPLDVDQPDGYLESDSDYMENNRVACVAYLDRMGAEQHILHTDKTELAALANELESYAADHSVTDCVHNIIEKMRRLAAF
jgi:hypothetical protein